MLRIKLNESEIKDLETRLKRAKSQSTLIYLDLKIIELSHQGKSVPQISDLLGLHANTVRSLIKKFQADSFAGLNRKPRGKPEEKLKAYDKPIGKIFCPNRLAHLRSWRRLTRIGVMS